MAELDHLALACKCHRVAADDRPAALDGKADTIDGLGQSLLCSEVSSQVANFEQWQARQTLRRWKGEARTVIAVLHDLDQVRAHFDQTLLLAREPVAWGATAEVLQAAHLFRARQMAVAWDDALPPCEVAR